MQSDEYDEILLVIVTIVYKMRMNNQDLYRIVNQLSIMVDAEIVMMEIALFINFSRLRMLF